jgi:hypothetical protein
MTIAQAISTAIESGRVIVRGIGMNQEGMYVFPVIGWIAEGGQS